MFVRSLYKGAKMSHKRRRNKNGLEIIEFNSLKNGRIGNPEVGGLKEREIDWNDFLDKDIVITRTGDLVIGRGLKKNEQGIDFHLNRNEADIISMSLFRNRIKVTKKTHFYSKQLIALSIVLNGFIKSNLIQEVEFPTSKNTKNEFEKKKISQREEEN